MLTIPPRFRSPDFLRDQIASTMAFYHPRCIDPAGGFFQSFRDNGAVGERGHRHLLGSCRFVCNYAMAAIEFRDAEYREVTRHGLDYLRHVHRDTTTGSYAWMLRNGKRDDGRHHACGAAAVLLAYASALKAGIGDAAAWLDETWQLLELRYWDADAELYRNDADADWVFTAYRGQRANMQLCEALIAAHEAGADARYLDRAFVIADHITRRQAALAGGLVWEHHDADWNVDWDWHETETGHPPTAPGFEAGHLVAWAKLLLILDRHRHADWLLPTARHLYDNALAKALDGVDGGLFRSFAEDGRVCDDDKHGWVQAEAIAAAALLASTSGDEKYWRDYQRLWDYAWARFVDHRHGGWFSLLDRNNRASHGGKGLVGKTGYPMQAFHEILALLRRQPELATASEGGVDPASGSVIGLR